MKVINFLAKHGLNPEFMNSTKEFDKAWSEFLCAGEELPTWPQSLMLVNISIKWLKQFFFGAIILIIPCYARLAVFIHPSLPSPSSFLPLYHPQFYGKNPPPIDHAMQRRVLIMWFRNHHINTSAYEQIPLSGQHTQMLEFDSVCLYLLW